MCLGEFLHYHIARVWRLVDSLASFNLGNSLRIGFWSDPWVGNTPFKEQFSSLFRIGFWSDPWVGNTPFKEQFS